MCIFVPNKNIGTMSLKNEIINLKKNGKSHKEISKILKCAKSTVSFHCKKEGLPNAERKIKQTNKRLKSYEVRSKGNYKNGKELGEIGEMICITEFLKMSVPVLKSYGDNLPFDFVIFYKNLFLKCQVKTSTTKNEKENVVYFGLTSNNWYKKTIKEYTKQEVDLFLLCDIDNIYIISIDEANGRKSIQINTDISKKALDRQNIAKDFLLTKDRLDKIIGMYLN